MSKESQKTVKGKGRAFHDPFAHAKHSAWTGVEVLVVLALFASLGALIAWYSMKRRRAGFEWAAVWLLPAGSAALLTYAGLISGWLAGGAIAVPTAIFIGHLGRGLVTHFDDRRAGHDRGHESRERTGPQHLLLRRRNLRRIRSMGSFDDLAIGVTQRGRVAAIKRGDESGSHSLIVGTTGAGKSTVLGVLAFEHAWSGHGVVLVEAKRDPQLEEQARRAAARWGRAFVMVSPEGPTVWDALASGGVDETVAKLLACEEWSEAFYKAEATRFLRWVVRAIDRCETPLTLPQVLDLCDPDRLAAHAAKHGNPALSEEIRQLVDTMTQQERRDVAGLRSRLAVLAESEFGRSWLDPDSGAGPVLDLAEAIRRRAVVYFRLDAERLGIVAEKVGAAIAIELGAIASGLQGSPIPTFVGIDELGAIESDHSARLFTRARGAGFSVAVATHTLADLRAAGEAFEAQVSGTIDSLIPLRVGPDDADAIARIAGQVGDWHHTEQTEGQFGTPRGVGTRSWGYRMRIHPSVLQNLRRGECAVIRLDRSDKKRAVIAEVVPSWERGVPIRPRFLATDIERRLSFDGREVAGVYPSPPDLVTTAARRLR
jgi:hypothetical protein